MADTAQIQKKRMKIALVGVKPADQIALKGYLRVLLRLDVELEWVPASEQNIDLFMIHNEFRGAPSVAKILGHNPSAAVLYVTRTEMGDGNINADLLTLPLKQIHELKHWLDAHVASLGSQSSVTNTRPHNTPNPAQVAAPASYAQSNLGDVVELIKRLQARSQAVYEITDGTESIAIIDAKRQLIWTKRLPNAIKSTWRLRPYTNNTPNDADSQDSTAWLYQSALQSTILVPLIQNDAYHLRFWAKPSEYSRKQELQIMTALESTPKNIITIAEQAGVSISVAKKITAALLFAGLLSSANYKHLQAPSTTAPQPKVAPKPASQPVIQKPEPKPEPTPQKQEKLGFLARLRQKLGL